MPRFRTKPVEIEAVQWDGNAHTANVFIGERFGVDWWYADTMDAAIIIPTLEGDMRGEKGDWIIKGAEGEFYPCKPAPFAKKYEQVDG